MIALLAANRSGEACEEGAQEQCDEKPVERVGDGFASGIRGLLFAGENLIDALIGRGAAEAGALRDGSSNIALIVRSEFAPHQRMGKNQADFGAQCFVRGGGNFVPSKKTFNEIAVGVDYGALASCGVGGDRLGTHHGTGGGGKERGSDN